MAQRRVNEVAFNFDSLTDMVTNLAGGLILIVLLLTVLNRQRASQAGAEAMKGARAGASASGKSLELVRLQNGAAILEQNLLPKLNAQIRKAQDEVSRLQHEVDAKQPREASDPKGKPGIPSRVDLRPPMLKKAEKRTAVAFVLLGKKVYYCLWDEYRNAFKREMERIQTAGAESPEMKSYMQGILKPLRSGDFDLHIKVLDIIGTRIEIEPRTLLKPGAKGETLAEALAPGSDFNRLLEGFDRNAYYVDFDVYPDSFDLFIELRQRILEKRFSYNWTPQAAGKELMWSPGQGTTN